MSVDVEAPPVKPAPQLPAAALVRDSPSQPTTPRTGAMDAMEAGKPKDNRRSSRFGGHDGDGAVSATVLPGGWVPNVRTEPVKPAPITSSNETSFIPLALARKHVQSIVADMKDMRQRHVEAVEKLVDHYETSARETREHYVQHVVDVRAAALARLTQYRDALRRTTASLTRSRRERKAERERFEERIRDIQRQKAEAMERAAMELQRTINKVWFSSFFFFFFGFVLSFQLLLDACCLMCELLPFPAFVILACVV